MIHFCNGDPIYVKMTTNFKKIQNVPDDECQIGDNTVIIDLPLCLMRCSKIDDCLTVVHDGKICRWYQSCERDHDKRPEQEIITKTDMERIKGKSVLRL